MSAFPIDEEFERGVAPTGGLFDDIAAGLFAPVSSEHADIAEYWRQEALKWKAEAERNKAFAEINGRTANDQAAIIRGVQDNLRKLIENQQTIAVQVERSYSVCTGCKNATPISLLAPLRSHRQCRVPSCGTLYGTLGTVRTKMATAPLADVIFDVNDMPVEAQVELLASWLLGEREIEVTR